MAVKPKTAQTWIHLFESEYGEYREVFFAYASAMFNAQPLEALLENILEGLHIIGAHNFQDKQWDWKSVFDSKMTLGSLNAEFQKYLRSKFNDKRTTKTVKKLDKCVQHRNWLAHDFFHETWKLLDDKAKREQLILKLGDISLLFTEMTSFLQPWSSEIARRLSSPGEYDKRLRAAGLD